MAEQPMSPPFQQTDKSSKKRGGSSRIRGTSLPHGRLSDIMGSHTPKSPKEWLALLQDPERLQSWKKNFYSNLERGGEEARQLADSEDMESSDEEEMTQNPLVSHNSNFQAGPQTPDDSWGASPYELTEGAPHSGSAGHTTYHWRDGVPVSNQYNYSSSGEQVFQEPYSENQLGSYPVPPGVGAASPIGMLPTNHGPHPQHYLGFAPASHGYGAVVMNYGQPFPNGLSATGMEQRAAAQWATAMELEQRAAALRQHAAQAVSLAAQYSPSHSTSGPYYSSAHGDTTRATLPGMFDNDAALAEDSEAQVGTTQRELAERELKASLGVEGTDTSQDTDAQSYTGESYNTAEVPEERANLDKSSEKTFLRTEADQGRLTEAAAAAEMRPLLTTALAKPVVSELSHLPNGIGSLVKSAVGGGPAVAAFGGPEESTRGSPSASDPGSSRGESSEAAHSSSLGPPPELEMSTGAPPKYSEEEKAARREAKKERKLARRADAEAAQHQPLANQLPAGVAAAAEGEEAQREEPAAPEQLKTKTPPPTVEHEAPENGQQQTEEGDNTAQSAPLQENSRHSYSGEEVQVETLAEQILLEQLVGKVVANGLIMEEEAGTVEVQDEDEAATAALKATQAAEEENQKDAEAAAEKKNEKNRRKKEKKKVRNSEKSAILANEEKQPDEAENSAITDLSEAMQGLHVSAKKEGGAPSLGGKVHSQKNKEMQEISEELPLATSEQPGAAKEDGQDADMIPPTQTTDLAAAEAGDKSKPEDEGEALATTLIDEETVRKDGRFADAEEAARFGAQKIFESARFQKLSVPQQFLEVGFDPDSLNPLLPLIQMIVSLQTKATASSPKKAASETLIGHYIKLLVRGMREFLLAKFSLNEGAKLTETCFGGSDGYPEEDSNEENQMCPNAEFFQALSDDPSWEGLVIDGNYHPRRGSVIDVDNSFGVLLEESLNLEEGFLPLRDQSLASSGTKNMRSWSTDDFFDRLLAERKLAASPRKQWTPVLFASAFSETNFFPVWDDLLKDELLDKDHLDQELTQHEEESKMMTNMLFNAEQEAARAWKAGKKKGLKEEELKKNPAQVFYEELKVGAGNLDARLKSLKARIHAESSERMNTKYFKTCFAAFEMVSHFSWFVRNDGYIVYTICTL